LPWSTTFDLGVHTKLRSLEIIELRADIFNIFNAENLSGYSNNATQNNQIQGLAPVDYLHKKKMQAEQFRLTAKILIKTSRWNLDGCRMFLICLRDIVEYF
jgi:hypothetical protein